MVQRLGTWGEYAHAHTAIASVPCPNAVSRQLCVDAPTLLLPHPCCCHTDKLRRRFLPQRQSLAAVIQDDARLAGLSEQQIQAEVRTQVRQKAREGCLVCVVSRFGRQQPCDSASAGCRHVCDEPECLRGRLHTVQQPLKLAWLTY